MFICNLRMFMHLVVYGRKFFLWYICVHKVGQYVISCTNKCILFSVLVCVHHLCTLSVDVVSPVFIPQFILWNKLVALVPKPSNLATEVMTVGWLHGMVCWVRGCSGSLDLSVYYLPLLLSLWLALASVPCMIQSASSLQSCLAVVLQLSI